MLLIDGRNFVYRNAYTRPGLRSQNRPTGAIYGCLSGLIRLGRLFPDARIVFCWDGEHARESWRNKLAASYKGNRIQKNDKDTPQVIKDIRQQIPIVVKMLDMLGFKQYTVDRLEADDLIGILATSLKQKYDKIIIYSMDKDFYQLIKGNVAVVRDLDKKIKCQEITPKEIKKRHGVVAKHWLHFRSLVGEKTDHIAKPIVGVGPKKAIAMLKAGVDPSSSIPHKDYKEHWAKIRLCYRLTKIVRKVHDKRLPEETQEALRVVLDDALVADLQRKNKDNMKAYNRLLKFLRGYELSDIIARREQLWQIK